MTDCFWQIFAVSNALELFFVIFHLLTIILSTIITTILIYRLCKFSTVSGSKSRNKKNKKRSSDNSTESYKYEIVAASISSVLAFIIRLFLTGFNNQRFSTDNGKSSYPQAKRLYDACNWNYNQTKRFFDAIDSLGTLFHIIHFLFIYMIYYHRLKLIFSHSAFDVSLDAKISRKLRIFQIILIVTLSLCIAGVLGELATGALPDAAGIIVLLSFGIFFIVYFIGTVYLSSTMVKKLNYLISLFPATQTNSLDISDDMSSQKRSIMDTMARVTILVCVTTGSTVILFIISVGFLFIDNSTVESIGLMLTDIDGVINLICLALQFKFFEGYYFRCCHCFHNVFIKNPGIIDKLTGTVKNQELSTQLHRTGSNVSNASSFDKSRSGNSGTGGGINSQSPETPVVGPVAGEQNEPKFEVQQQSNVEMS